MLNLHIAPVGYRGLIYYDSGKEAVVGATYQLLLRAASGGRSVRRTRCLMLNENGARELRTQEIRAPAWYWYSLGYRYTMHDTRIHPTRHLPVE